MLQYIGNDEYEFIKDDESVGVLTTSEILSIIEDISKSFELISIFKPVLIIDSI